MSLGLYNVFTDDLEISSNDSFGKDFDEND